MITIVLGMHRSGTSVVAGILHFNKIIMGTYDTFWPRPLPQNPKGFYENYDFRKINDTILITVFAIPQLVIAADNLWLLIICVVPFFSVFFLKVNLTLFKFTPF